MRKTLTHPLTLTLAGGLVAAPAAAADLKLKLVLPEIGGAEYHRPYVAVFVEPAEKIDTVESTGKTLAVWYDVDKRNNVGSKWLKDMRQWWRRAGRELTLPIEGVSSATRTAGTHELSFSSAKSPLKDLAPGNYKLQVEAAREHGGRELVSIPFTWPLKKAEQLKAQGSTELGAVTLDVTP